MLLLINRPFYVQNFGNSVSSLKSSPSGSVCLGFNPKKMYSTCRRTPVFTRFLGPPEIRVSYYEPWRRSSRMRDGDVQLEAEIMDFMVNSEKPSMFPTEEELRKGGRADLAEAIRKKGGWLALGWGEESVKSSSVEDVVYDFGKSRLSLDYDNGRGFSQELKSDAASRLTSEDSFSSEESTYLGILNSSQIATSVIPDISLGIGANEDSGIQGILCRLEKQRNMDLGISTRKNGHEALATMKLDGNDRNTDISSDFANIGEDGTYRNRTPNASGSLSGAEPESWRSWISRQSGLEKFEAAEISYRTDQPENKEDNVKAVDNVKDLDHAQIRARLQYLEVELKAVLRSLRSKSMEYISEQVGRNITNPNNITDAWEFKENEFMSSQESLRSIRAKIAVLEGKMALAIIDSRRKIEMKQKRIDNAQTALKLLRTTSVIWAVKASEVLLTGSFDGWTTKRKMNRSETGEFSYYLKLYPGRYEIKFIVDGVWRIDPLRPTVIQNGFENNLLTVT